MNNAANECWILCCECGTAIQPNSANMCLPCIRNRVDITEGLPKQISIHFCRNCERYLQPPSHWLACQLESRELLGLCLKKIKGLGSKAKLIDAGFLWTEPHSKRLRLKITVQKEVLAATILQQTFSAEVIICSQQCPDCAKVMAKNMWKACVQIRQKVDHKRTLLYLEQIILKHSAHKDATNIKSQSDGLDFYYAHRTHAIKMTEFLASVVPTRSKVSEQLISTDIHSGSSSYKFTYSVEILPLCKDDLVCLPAKTAKSTGIAGQICLCARVGNIVHLLDPLTLTTADLPTAVYWRTPFTSLCSYKDLVPFIVLDIEETGKKVGRLFLADAEVARVADFGKTNESFHVRTHLGRILSPGDTVLGYDLATANFNNMDFSAHGDLSQDVVLVKKSYAEGRKHKSALNKRRQWRLKYLEKQDTADDEPAGGEPSMSAVGGEKRERNTTATRKQAAIRAKEQMDLEIFMQELEEDPELRANVRLYKAQPSRDPRHTDIALAGGHDLPPESHADADSVPEIDVAELLDDLSLGEDSDGECYTRHGGSEDEQSSGMMEDD